MLQLYVLGPAFGLPSIDAECNAAIGLLQTICGRNSDAWEIIPVHDERRVPCLRDDTHSSIGFQNIARHLEQRFPDALPALNERTLADSIAVSSFIASQAPTLLSVYLYVSFENWRNATRPSFTRILPWYVNYITPPRLRNAARAGAAHLGISSIDVDNVHDDTSNRPQELGVMQDQEFEKAAQQRASLLLPRKETLRSMLQRPEHAAIFKLQNLADAYLGPLADILGDKTYMLGTERATSVDLFAYGYLSLMLFADVPQDWLRRTMRDKYGPLARYTERLHGESGVHTDVDVVMKLARRGGPDEAKALAHEPDTDLPWTPPVRPSFTEQVSTITQGLWSLLPVIGPSITIHTVNPKEPSFWQRYYPTLFIGVTMSLALAGYYFNPMATLIWPRTEEVHIFGKRRLSDYGHLGAALSGFALIGQPARMGQHDPNSTQSQGDDHVQVKVIVAEGQ